MPRLSSFLFLAAACVLAMGCACGSEKTGQNTTTDRLDATPVGLYTRGSDDWREALQCDSSRNCVMRFRNYPDSATVWTVYFTLQPGETMSIPVARRYL